MGGIVMNGIYENSSVAKVGIGVDPETKEIEKKFTTNDDRKKLNEIVAKEMLHYSEIRHYCKDVTENLWKLVNMIHENREITIGYHKIDKTFSERRIQPVSLIFMEYYFYLIALATRAAFN
jgi:predicted DNA-binding transcriptional regulator YafY